jgi:hypothetical protein
MPIPVFPKRDAHSDPYKNFRFRVKWDGRYVAGVSKVSALIRTTEVVTPGSVADAAAFFRVPGPTACEPITLERGITGDPPSSSGPIRSGAFGTQYFRVNRTPPLGTSARTSPSRSTTKPTKKLSHFSSIGAGRPITRLCLRSMSMQTPSPLKF